MLLLGKGRKEPRECGRAEGGGRASPRHLGTGCSATTAKDSELSNPEVAAAVEDATDSSHSRSVDVESSVER